MSRVLLIGIVAALELTSPLRAASAQPPAPPVGQEAASQVVSRPPAERDPHRFLALARQQLQLVPTQNLSGDGKKKLKKLHEDVEQLAAAYDQRAPMGSAAEAAVNAKSSAEPADWKAKFAAVERDLA